ncbi:MAG: OmpA family protein [Deltaproteobacteria bacterium]|nr:OmpA family protein [Deltaproteobacteria bacterium]
MNSVGPRVLVVGILAAVFASGCTSPEKRTGIGAGVGAGTGAIIGGLGAGWKGAAIGAAAGAATGAAVGNYLDKQAKELAEVAATRRVKDGILVDLKSDLLFDVGSSQVKPKARQQLQQLGQILVKYPDDRIRVEGFTDSTGTATLNEVLSRQRADSVREILQSQGVRSDQILVFGYGESRPIASNTSPTGRQLNRRVDLIIDVPQGRVPASK